MVSRNLAVGVLGAIGCIALVGWLLDGDEGFGGGPQNRPRPQGGVYRCAVPRPATINPLTQNDAVAERYVLRYTHDTLFDRDPIDGSLRPAAAIEARSGASAGEYSFVLRPGIRFADAAPVTADDLRFLVRAAKHPRLEPKSGGARWLSQVEVEVVDSDGLRLNVRLPNASRSTFEQFATAVHLVQAKGMTALVEAQSPGLEPFSDEFLDVLSQLKDSGPGTGPYKLRDGRRLRDGSTSLDLIPNALSWHRAERPESWNLAGIRLRHLTDPAGQLNAVLRQELDFLVPVDGSPSGLLEEYPKLAPNYRVEQLRPNHLGCLFVGWNLRRAPLDKPEVRQLLGELFDREAIAKVAFQGSASVARGWYRDADEEIPRRTIEEIRKALVALGIEPRDQRPLQALTARESVQIQRSVDLARDAFRQLGWELTPVSVDGSGLDQRIDDGDFDLFLQFNYQDMPPDPFDAFHSSANRLGYAEASMDQLLDSLRISNDQAATQTLFGRFEDLLREHAPVTPLVHPALDLLLHRRFQDTESGPVGLIPERWWVPEDQRLPAQR